jgi:hypothetical protein
MDSIKDNPQYQQAYDRYIQHVRDSTYWAAFDRAYDEVFEATRKNFDDEWSAMRYAYEQATEYAERMREQAALNAEDAARAAATLAVERSQGSA